MQTILITGTGSGIGQATAKLFARKGWCVFATDRKRASSPAGKNTVPMLLDVNDPRAIANAFKAIKEQADHLDCVVNNAGWGLFLPFEDTTQKETEEMYRTNVFGLMEVTRHACAIMRKQKGGTIINISSVAGQRGSPLYSVYASTKWAVEGFSEALAHEMRALGVHVKIVEPGRVKTAFFDRAYGQETLKRISDPYRAMCERKIQKHRASLASDAASAEDVAQIIFSAATDGSWRLRYPVGKEAETILQAKHTQNDQEFFEEVYKEFTSPS
ncbi:MAG: SDR family oxidoreductase [Candidatus Peregrinibacteria bacterium]